MMVLRSSELGGTLSSDPEGRHGHVAALRKGVLFVGGVV